MKFRGLYFYLNIILSKITLHILWSFLFAVQKEEAKFMIDVMSQLSELKNKTRIIISKRCIILKFIFR